MKWFVAGCASVVGIVAILLFAVFGFYFSTIKSGANHQEGVRAQQEVCKVTYDETWKVISETAQVPDAYKSDFKDAWKTIMEGANAQQRTAAVSAFVTRFNPNFDSSLYTKLMTVIEAKRSEYSRAQKVLIDKNREYNVWRTTGLVNTGLGRSVFGVYEPIEITVVTSDATEKAYRDGKSDAIDVFGRKK